MKDEVFSATDTSNYGAPVAEVLGVPLLPVSLWHIWFLKSADSPFIIGGEPTEQDFAIALVVCSKTKKQMSEILLDESVLADEVSSVADSWFKIDESELPEHIQAFDEYLSGGVSGPEFWQDPDQDGVKDRQRCPSEWHLVYLLLNNNICKTENEAWDYQFNRAVCWSAVVGEQNGSRAYIDPIDREQIQQVNS